MNTATTFLQRGRRQGFLGGLFVGLLIAGLIFVVVGLAGCATGNTITIPAPPPMELEPAKPTAALAP